MCKISETVKQIWWEIRGASYITNLWNIQKDVDIDKHSLTIYVKGNKKVKIEATPFPDKTQNVELVPNEEWAITPINYTVTLMRTDNSVVATKKDVCCDCLVQTINTMLNTLRIGDTIKYETWSGQEKTAKVERIELCKKEHEKEGVEVNEVQTSDMYRCCLDLEGYNWCYGSQILEIL